MMRAFNLLRHESKFTYAEAALCLVLFLLSLFIRTRDLDVFATVDEPRWVSRSLDFLGYVSRGDWQGTLQVVHPLWFSPPGVTTMWTGALGAVMHGGPHLTAQDTGSYSSSASLAESLQGSLALLAAMRYPTAFLTALLPLLTYILLKKSLGRRIASLAAVLLAFDPFYMALSRVLHHDALHATFAFLGVLCLGVAWERRRSWGWPIAAGVAFGLAFLSKSLALVLIPFVLSGALLTFVLQPDGGRRGADKKLWAGVIACWAVMLLTIFALWPALWVAPSSALGVVLNTVRDSVASPHESGNFFWGEAVDNPGSLFYPVVLLYRGSPLVLIGALFSAVWVIIQLRAGWRNNLVRIFWIFLLWGLVAAYVLSLSLGAKKFDRYILPAFLAIDLLAAIGWVALSDKWVQAHSGWKRRAVVFGQMGVLGVQILLCMSHSPYYFSYYDPAVTWARPAEQTLEVGWGEGLDQVVNYLNERDDASRLILSTNYDSLIEFQGFKGKVVKFPPSWSDDKPKYPLAQLDFICLYSSWLQSHPIPSSFFEEYFGTEQPEFLARINGIEYAWLYRVAKDQFLALPDDAFRIAADYGNGLKLVGCKIYQMGKRGDGPWILPVEIFWQVKRPCIKDYRFVLRLVAENGDVKASKKNYPPWGPDDCEASLDFWRGDLVYPDEHWLEVGEDTPPGSYALEAVIVHEPDQRPLPPLNRDPVVNLGVVTVPSP